MSLTDWLVTVAGGSLWAYLIWGFICYPSWLDKRELGELALDDDDELELVEFDLSLYEIDRRGLGFELGNPGRWRGDS